MQFYACGICSFSHWVRFEITWIRIHVNYSVLAIQSVLRICMDAILNFPARTYMMEIVRVLGFQFLMLVSKIILEILVTRIHEHWCSVVCFEYHLKNIQQFWTVACSTMKFDSLKPFLCFSASDDKNEQDQTKENCHEAISAYQDLFVDIFIHLKLQSHTPQKWNINALYWLWLLEVCFHLF